MRPAWIAVLLAGSSAAWAQAGGPNPDAGVPSIALLDFQGNQAGAVHAAPFTALLAAELARSPQVRVVTQADVAAVIGLERQRQVLGGECDAACQAQLGKALGTSYLASGRVDGFGAHLVVTATLLEISKDVSVAKPRVDVPSGDELPEAARTVAVELLAALGIAPPAEPPAASLVAGASLGPSVSLKVGPQFFVALESANLEADFEIGYRFQPEWVAMIEIGFALVRSNVGEGRVTVVPTILGARHLYRIDRDLQPYWGLGLGLQLALGNYGIFQNSGPLPTVLVLLGFQYLVTKHFAAGLESRTNLSETILGIADPSSGGAGNGFNLDLVGTLTWRF